MFYTQVFLSIIFFFGTIIHTYAVNKTLPQVSAVCFSCHGKKGLGLQDITPMIAGQSLDYLRSQLHHFITQDRKNSVMQGMSLMLSNPKDREAVTEYFSSLKPPRIKKLKYRGQTAVFKDPYEKIIYQGDWSRSIPACVTCHGASGMGVGHFPRLAGQHEIYIVNQLNNWQTGSRKGEDLQIMEYIAKQLTQDEINGIASYFSKRAVR